MFEVNIYLETSLRGPGTRKGWYAAVVEYQTKRHGIQTREIFEEEEKTTYNKSVILALIESLKILNAECVLTVYTNSVYLESNFKNGNFQRWKANGFLNVKGEPIKNQEQWQQLADLIERHSVTFERKNRHTYSAWINEEIKRRIETEKNVEKTECEGVSENEQ